MKTINVHTEELEIGKAPLFHKYAAQCTHQPARLELDPRERSVCGSINYNIGNSDSANIWHGLIITVRVSAYVSGSALIAFMNDKNVHVLINRIFEGHRLDDRNHGHLDDSAEGALDKLESLAENIENINVWECGDWLNDNAIYRDDNDRRCDHDDATTVEFVDIMTVTAFTTKDDFVQKIKASEDGDVYIYGIEDYFDILIGNLESNTKVS